MATTLAGGAHVGMRGCAGVQEVRMMMLLLSTALIRGCCLAVLLGSRIDRGISPTFQGVLCHLFKLLSSTQWAQERRAQPLPWLQARTFGVGKEVL